MSQKDAHFIIPKDPNATDNPQNKFLLQSRVIIKHLPSHVAKDRLERIVAPYGDITDIKIMKTKEGVSRGFAFVGYKTNKAAKKAIKGLDGTYVDMNKIQVEFAQPYESTDLARPWSKHSKGSSRFEEIQKQKTEREQKKKADSGVVASASAGKKTAADAEMSDELREYLGLTQKKGTFWANDIDVAATAAEKKKQVATAKAAKKKDAKADSDEEDNDAMDIDSEEDSLVPSAVDEDESSRAKKRAKKSAAAAADDDDLDTGAADNTVNNQKVFSDLDYLRSRMTDDIPDDEDEEDAVEAADAPAAASSASASKAVPVKEEEPVDVMESGRIFIYNLSFETSEEEIIDLCKRFGELTEVHIPINTASKKSKGVAFVTFLIPENAKKALDNLNNTIFQGRMIHVTAAKPLPQKSLGAAGVGGSYKKKLELKRRLEAQSAHNWNTLYLNQDTVLDQTAKNLQVQKSDLLLNGAGNTAVRLALGETELLKTTKDALEEAGIDLSSINLVDRTPTTKTVIINNPNRSKTCILVKNLPPDTTEQDLQQMFAEFGDLSRVLLFSGVLALIEYLEPSHARKAFRNLAGKKYKNTLLYLEWAPIKAKKQGEEAEAAAPKKKPTSVIEEGGVRKLKDQAKLAAIVGTDANANTESATLYIKNLNFQSTEEGLKAFLIKCLQGLLDTQQDASQFVRKTTIPKVGTGGRSAGFGFAEFASFNIAKLIVDNCQNKVLDGHALLMQYQNVEKKTSAASAPAASSSVESAGKADSADFFLDKEGRKLSFKKLLVRNVPFEATRQDLLQLFGTYGVVSSVRVPMKVTGGHKGYAFVDFATVKEARAAYDALKNTHLYGRRLNIEYAADEEETNVDLQKDRQQKRQTQGYGSGKKRKRDQISSGEDHDQNGGDE